MRNAILIALILAGVFVRRTIVRAMFSPAVTVATTIPADFPRDVPLPKDAECKQSAKVAGVFRLQLDVKQDATTLRRFYENELAGQGWVVERISDDMKEDKDEEGVMATKPDGHFFAARIDPSSKTESELTLTVK